MRTAIWVGEGSDRSGEELLEEIVAIAKLGKKFSLEKTTIEDLRENDCYEDDTDEDLDETKDFYITVVTD